MARPHSRARKHPLARRAAHLRHTRRAGAYGWSFKDWVLDAQYLVTRDAKVLRYVPRDTATRPVVEFLYDAKAPNGPSTVRFGSKTVELGGFAYLEGGSEKADTDALFAMVDSGSSFDEEDVARKRANAEAAKSGGGASGGGSSGGGGGGSSGGGGGGCGGGSSGGGGGGSGDDDQTPVLAPPKTVPDTDDKKFWQETWFIATAGTLVAGGVGYGIWRFARTKKGA